MCAGPCMSLLQSMPEAYSLVAYSAFCLAFVMSVSCTYCYCYCYWYMVQDLPEHPIGSQRGSWGTSVIIRI
jgi:hypothetical protein